MVFFVIQLPSIFYEIKIQIFCFPHKTIREREEEMDTRKAPINLFDAIVHTNSHIMLSEKIAPMRTLWLRLNGNCDFLSPHNL